MARLPPAPVKVGDHTLDIDPIIAFGYLTLETDGRTLTAVFKTADKKGVTQRDSVTVDIEKGTITSKPSRAPAKPKQPAAPAKRKAAPKKTRSTAKTAAPKRKAPATRKTSRR